MHVLVLNSGSSSLKVKLLQMPEERETAFALVERIGEAGGGSLRWRLQGEADERRGTPCPDHAAAVRLVLDTFASRLPFFPTVGLAGHRMVHGGELFDGPVLVDDGVLERIETLKDLAPLHMPPALCVLRACRRCLPAARQVACFDTTFYAGLPAMSYLYAVPAEWYAEHGVRRFGFHGLSHQYVTLRAAQMLGVPAQRLRLVSAHLGNGASVTAFDRGRVLDTSMGFTPLEGMIMGTRAGYLDPAVLAYLQRRTGMTLEHMIDLLNSRSGLTAVSGRGRDLRVIMEARSAGDARAELAVAMYVHTLRKYIGAYLFALGGAQAIVLTGGVGENAAEIRALALNGLEEMGLILEAQANRSMVDGRCGDISAAASRIRILVIPTNEECMIARQACQLVGDGPPTPVPDAHSIGH